MIKLELELSELDYAALIERVLPLVGDRLDGHALGHLLGSGPAAAMARAALVRMPQEKKDRMAVSLVNENADRIAAALENAAGKNGVTCHVRHVRAKTED